MELQKSNKGGGEESQFWSFFDNAIIECPHSYLILSLDRQTCFPKGLGHERVMIKAEVFLFNWCRIILRKCFENQKEVRFVKDIISDFSSF